MPASPPKRRWKRLVPRPRLHLDAAASSRSIHQGLLKLGHDATRTPQSWIALHDSDEQQLLGATAHGRCIFTFDIADFMDLADVHPDHAGIILAARDRWTDSQIVAALHRLLTTTDADEWRGQVRWLNDWRTATSGA